MGELVPDGGELDDGDDEYDILLVVLLWPDSGLIGMVSMVICVPLVVAAVVKSR